MTSSPASATKAVLGERLVFLLLVGSAGLYTTRVSLSPIYLFFGLGLVLSPLLAFWGRKVDRLAVAWYVAVGICLLVGLPVEVTNLKNISVTIGFWMSLLALPVVLDRGEGCSPTYILKGSMVLIWLSIILVSADAFLRFKNPNYSYLAMGAGAETENLVFYAYKFNGIMYLDSNFVGIQTTVLFGLVCYLSEYFEKPFLLEKLLLAILSVLTLSRASIIAVLVVFLYSLRKNRRLMLMTLVATGFGIVVWGFSYVSHDQSFASKGEIWERFFRYLNGKATVSGILFGLGFNRSVDAIDMGAHNLIVLLVIEKGLLGLALMLALWWKIGQATAWAALYLFIPFFINGMSLTTHAAPYFYVSAAVIILLVRLQRKDGLGVVEAGRKSL